MTRWAEPACLAGKHKQPLFPAVRTPDAGKAAHGIAAIQVLLYNILDHRTEEAVLPLETILVFLKKLLEIVKKHPVKNGVFRMTLFESHSAPFVLGRKIRAPVEGFELRCEENGHRPPAASGNGHDCRHVYVIQVGTFFPVHFDGNEVIVQDFGDLFILESFSLHHMTPVTGGISDRKKNGFVFFFCLRQGFLSPRVPLHGIVGMLKEIRAGFIDELVRVSVFLAHHNLLYMSVLGIVLLEFLDEYCIIYSTG